MKVDYWSRSVVEDFSFSLKFGLLMRALLNLRTKKKMDSFEFSKIAGAVLSALLVIVGAKTLIDLNIGHENVDDQAVGYVLEQGEEDESKQTAAKEGEPADAAAKEGGSQKASEEFDAAKVVALVAGLKASDGEKLFKKCRGCHNASKGEGAKIGPNLWGVVERPKGSVEGFEYSSAMLAKGGSWTLEDLATFIHKPKAFVPKTKMTFKGIKKDGDLAKLLAYLSNLK